MSAYNSFDILVYLFYHSVWTVQKILNFEIINRRVVHILREHTTYQLHIIHLQTIEYIQVYPYIIYATYCVYINIYMYIDASFIHCICLFFYLFTFYFCRYFSHISSQYFQSHVELESCLLCSDFFFHFFFIGLSLISCLRPIQYTSALYSLIA